MEGLEDPGFNARIQRLAQLISFGQDVSEFDPMEVAAAKIYLKHQSDDPVEEGLTFVALEVLFERRMREADITSGKRVPHGSSQHVKDLEVRIRDLVSWRDRQKRGTEARANYSRLISRLKGELASARRATAKKPK